jgi:hypothetical protein
VLLLYWLWLQRLDPGHPWVALPVHDDPTTLAFFKASTYSVTGDGCSTIFWIGSWLDGRNITDLALELFAAIPHCHRKARSIRLALLDITTVQYLHFHHRVSVVELLPGTLDQFVWCWSASGRYSTSIAYKAMFMGQSTILEAMELWISKAPKKCHFSSGLCFWVGVGRRCISSVTGSITMGLVPSVRRRMRS